MRRSRILLILALIIAIIYAVFNKLYVGNEDAVKTLNESDTIMAENTKLEDGMERYSALVYLNSGDTNLNGIVELEVISKVKYNKEEKSYILENPTLNINPIACKLSEKNGETRQDNKLIGYYRFSLSKGEEFEGVMTVASAKAIQANKDISVVKILDSLDSKINSLDLLEKAKGNDKNIKLEYKNNNQSFDIWYEISFFIDENKEGYFKIF